MFFDKQGLSSISRFRDVIKQFGEKIDFVLVGNKNQTKVHYAMLVCTMLYDALGYTNQCKELENVHRKAKDLSTPEEFLSNMKKNKASSNPSSILWRKALGCLEKME